MRKCFWVLWLVSPWHCVQLPDVTCADGFCVNGPQSKGLQGFHRLSWTLIKSAWLSGQKAKWPLCWGEKLLYEAAHAVAEHSFSLNDNVDKQRSAAERAWWSVSERRDDAVTMQRSLTRWPFSSLCSEKKHSTPHYHTLIMLKKSEI